MIPDKWLVEHVNLSLEIIKEEGQYPSPLFHVAASMQDNFTD